MPQDPTALGAIEQSRAIHARQFSCVELMQATLARIQALNPTLNAIVNAIAPEQALALALQRDHELGGPLRRHRGRTGSRGWMHGMPQAIKDTTHAVGFATSMGSPLLAKAVAAQDSVAVQRVKAAGCIVLGKTNVPEFGMGSHTYNTVFGATGNAWDTSRSAGGSSGGAAVALAQRLLPVADGSDLMGSLRNPAAWNHVFGLRPSPGRVPSWPRPDQWLLPTLATEGPMGRSVRDVAALLTTQAGYDLRSPLSLPTQAQSFVPSEHLGTRSIKGLRVGWLGSLNGHLALEPGILALCEAALQRMQSAGAQIQALNLEVPGLSLDQIWQCWLAWRAAVMAPPVNGLLQEAGARPHIKPEALWEAEQGRTLSAMDFALASQQRSRFALHMAGLFEQVDVLALPVAQVWPFAMELPWPQTVAGRPMDTYHRWMECTLYATLAGLPAISVPVGFHANGRWPMGMQLMGPAREDAALLRVAAGYEAMWDAAWLAKRPPAPPPL